MAATLKYIQPDAEQFMIHLARVSSSNDENPEYQRLLQFCMREGHWSVFEMVDVEMDLPKMRQRGSSNRQGSLPYMDPEMQYAMDNKALAPVLYAVRAYQDLVDSGVALESARLILPMCVGTRLYMKGTVRDWLHYCRVRMDKHTQEEHRLLATDCWNVLKEVLPVTTEAFEKHHMESKNDSTQ
jgi:thymidylate synthase (FAD)